jgi:hypothetical protein
MSLTFEQFVNCLWSVGWEMDLFADRDGHGQYRGVFTMDAINALPYFNHEDTEEITLKEDQQTRIAEILTDITGIQYMLDDQDQGKGHLTAVFLPVEPHEDAPCFSFIYDEWFNWFEEKDTNRVQFDIEFYTRTQDNAKFNKFAHDVYKRIFAD